jgi:tetratricopeptide (TPR) repeat protein
MSRLSEINTSLDLDGNPGTSILLAKDTIEKADMLAARGDAAYFGFDPVCALFWYNQSDTMSGKKSSEKKFHAAVAACLYQDAKENAATSAEKAGVLVMEGATPYLVARQLNEAVTDAWKAGLDISSAVEPVLLMLPPEDRIVICEKLTDRSTRDDEKSLVCSGIAQSYMSLGMPDEARQMFRTALRANPGAAVRSRILSEIGWVEYETGNYSASSEAYLSALKINERFPAAWAGLAKSCICDLKYDEARAALERALYQNPANTTYQEMHDAVKAITERPMDEAADRFFALGGPANLSMAAALYSEKSQNGFVKDAWDVTSVADVLKYRK